MLISKKYENWIIIIYVVNTFPNEDTEAFL